MKKKDTKPIDPMTTIGLRLFQEGIKIGEIIKFKNCLEGMIVFKDSKFYSIYQKFADNINLIDLNSDIRQMWIEEYFDKETFYRVEEMKVDSKVELNLKIRNIVAAFKIIK